ncbi:DNA mismatch repair protein MutL [Flavobacterium indicum GPTSA100-9 = DSM 17447]|uniref:DNA mismatch repair protein MutL n=1 Tax=Flavobacterium indicum (strain DSM 17447 / CIP 109464 / GPTSA100-9) TaxID=1094466 RepID=H8XVT2_FLAIG|nr:DNA mismatch repair endonuclease MutL [Flavobacterium indicum]CCG54046.1 DNA mismatch repair protein MutL [Flavobacterium indicum GPTSA100-9 = DSM 17447]
MSGIIQLLPDHVANQIAAGEVVQRPASVVKELVENAVDANATEIKLIIKDAGKTLIQVIDNGKGMNVTDARLCFERHATSKIRHAEDLFALHTKGFRGEALASIAAVAHVELKTKQDQEELGTHVIIEGSKFVSQEVAVLPKGTSFLVKNLFFNIPARRNFLKSDNVELKHIIDEFERVALAHPAIHFVLISNGAEIFNLPSTNYRQRIVNIFGGKTNEKLVPVNEETEIITISGFVGKPEFAKKNRSEQFFLVNDRFIKSSFLHHAVMSAYDGLLKDGNQPSYFLYLQVPTHTIDINIHPTKTEVKFDDEQALYAILRSAVKHSLGMFNVAPVLDFERDATLDTPYAYKDIKSDVPLIQVDSTFNPFVTDTKKSSSSSNVSSGFSIYKKQDTTSNWESLYVGLKQDTFEVDNHTFETEEAVTSKLFDDEVTETKTLLYQLNRKYIINSIKSGLLVIHQNRAHQRILYEQFLTNITIHHASSQQLIFPLCLHLGREEVLYLKELQPNLEGLGFAFESIALDEVRIIGLPVQVKESEVVAILNDLIHNLQQNIPEDSFSLSDSIAKFMAKSVAIKSGKTLNEIELSNIVNGLFACKEPNFSPFNQPIFITLTTDELDKRF